ncbi:MAG: hypothetical protein A2W90_17040 [Bacteroidetes bacterium GWF2_42_66]|nr:MAG: hypothetical protein A2W92_15695 [Bacteroidetes bacterium GWA2_42_15]OFX97761.1 MAG: hypothetical protein A2W89_06995 [Bacteroidetes bacterium GWE2_42_39]OFY45500.1 MAG: hypothetical protein A2W90_17040 [Bacteroidetes bacterium GWF2_42_66]HBL73793.1 hypothetical protein [Prolixibacteraceae bacterium]HCU63745.1 hypothetical protein [Prolixibacteraceae bacterium]
MKKTIFTLLIFLLTINTFSQQTDTIDVSKPTLRKLSGIVDIEDLVKEGFNYWEEEFTGHWAGIAFGLNGFAKADYSLYPEEQKGFLDSDMLKSHSLQINLFQISKGLQSNRNAIGLVTGLGMNIRSYRLSSNTTIEQADNGMIYPKTLHFESNQKSKLSSVYLTVPLLLEFQIPVKHYANRFYVSGGLIANKRLSTHTKIKYRKDDQKEKLKIPGSYSIPEYKLSATVRMGYRRINIFASYDLAPLFKNDKGPVLYPYTVGIYLLGF